MTDKLEYFKLGKIVTTRGLKGEIKIYPHTDKIDRFKDLEYFFIATQVPSRKSCNCIQQFYSC